MKRILILICLFAAVGTAQAEAFDSLRIVLKIFDKDTKAPISATTRFESMPYGNKIGLRHGAEVIFRIESGEVFNVMVKAEGYMPVTITIDQKDYLGIHEIIEEVELTTNRIGHVMRLENMNFAQSSSEITQEMHEELDKLVVMLKGHPSMEIRLEGHTDYRGDAKANMKLSEERVTRGFLNVREVFPDVFRMFGRHY